MKKTLIALATLAAAGTSFAQSSVTISGLLDVAAYQISGNGTNTGTKAQSLSSRVGSATSAINFNVVEDLGGGLKAQAFVALDPRDFAADGAGIARHETFVGVSGDFGNLRLGAVNSGSLSASGAGSVLGTATGSGYGFDLAAGGAIRYSRNIRFDTPRINGFAASINYAPGNDDGALAATALGAAVTPAAQRVTDLGLSYVAGPINVTASSLQRSASVTAVKSTYNSVGANITVGAARVFGTYGKGDNSSQAPTAAAALYDTTAGQDSKLTRIGASYTMGATTLMASTANAKIGTGPTRTINGLRADYALSKRTAAYAAYEAIDNGAAANNEIKITAVGVRHSF